MKNSFVLYHDNKEIFDALKDESAGKLIKAIFEYEVTGNVLYIKNKRRYKYRLFCTSDLK